VKPLRRVAKNVNDVAVLARNPPNSLGFLVPSCPVLSPAVPPGGAGSQHTDSTETRGMKKPAPRIREAGFLHPCGDRLRREPTQHGRGRRRGEQLRRSSCDRPSASLRPRPGPDVFCLVLNFRWSRRARTLGVSCGAGLG
jgi:hypothetical protein